eukprot:31532-Pelagococcus_subviridis.AAC.3
MRVRVRLHLHPRHDALRDGQVVPADGEPQDVHLLAQLRQRDVIVGRHRHRLDAVQTFVHSDEREVDLVQHREHPRGHLVRRVRELDLDVGAVRDDVRGGQDEPAAALRVALDDRAGPGRSLRGLRLPRVHPVRLQERHEKLHDRAVLVHVERGVVERDGGGDDGLEDVVARDRGVVVRLRLVYGRGGGGGGRERAARGSAAADGGRRGGELASTMNRADSRAGGWGGSRRDARHRARGRHRGHRGRGHADEDARAGASSNAKSLPLRSEVCARCDSAIDRSVVYRVRVIALFARRRALLQ